MIKTKVYNNRYEWNRWFAWRPVCIGTYYGPKGKLIRKTAFWMWVERREVSIAGGWDSEWQYREIEKD